MLDYFVRESDFINFQFTNVKLLQIRPSGQCKIVPAIDFHQKQQHASDIYATGNLDTYTFKKHINRQIET
jgi:hypothetical protein